MAEKILNTRIALKIDTLENWGNSTLPLKKGELALATVAASAGTGLTEPVVMIKVGEDGAKTFKDLEWNVYAKASDVLAACKTEVSLKAFVNRVIADAGIATSEAMEALAGRVTTVEGEIDALQTDLNTAETGLKAKMSAAEAAIEAIEGRFGADTVALEISAAITALNLDNTYDAKGDAAAAETAAKGHADNLNTAMNARVEALEAIDHDHGNKAVLDDITAEKVAAWDAAEQNAKDYADDLDEAMDGRVAALEAKFGDGEGNVEAQIAAAVAAEAKLREEADADLQEQITANDGEILALQGLVGDKKVSEQITDVTNPLANRVATIEGDYLKAADKKALQDQIDANESAIELLTNGVSADEIDGVNDLIQYVKDHGTEVTGMKEDIQDNADAIAAEKQRAEGIEGGLETRLATVEAKLTDDGAVKSDIDAALEAAKGYTDAEVKELADGAVATNAAAIADLEALVGDDKVSDQITAVTNPMSEKITDLEGKAHKHANKTVLDGIEAADITAWDAKVDNVTAAAGSGLKATRTGNAVAIEIDESVTFVFDCGNSGVTA